MSDEPRRQVQDWWTNNPMDYAGAPGGVGSAEARPEIGSEAFYRDLDDRFFQWTQPLHGERHFSKLFPFNDHVGSRVLEIGCGWGTMAMVWAQAGGRITAVDMSDKSVEMTSRRLALFGLDGNVVQCDSRQLAFPSESFDYAYSWGVLHHSPALETSLAEMMRVLRPGARFGIMLYNRGSLFYWYRIRFVEGFVHMENRFLDPLELSSRYTDNASDEGNPHTWPVTEKEVRALLRPFAKDIDVEIFGEDLGSIAPQILPGFSRLIPPSWLRPWARRFGWSMWTTGTRIA